MGRKMIDKNDKSRVTEWLLSDDLQWLKREKERIEMVSGEKCEILSRKNGLNVRRNDHNGTVYALHYKDGYWKKHYNTREIIFIKKPKSKLAKG